MPIVIHRAPDPQPETAENDWDKAAGVVAMVAAGLIALKELFFEGLIIALVNWEPVRDAATAEEIRELKDMAGLLVIQTVAVGITNAVMGWGIYSRARWAFYAAPFVNIAALIGLILWLGDPGVEQAAFSVLLSGYCVARLCGALGPKP